MPYFRSATTTALALAVVGTLALPAAAQRYDNRYDRYDGNSRHDRDQRDRSRGDRNAPGRFDYYALVLSWSPTHCAERGDDDHTQCHRRDGRRYNFVLHGLWPQYERGFPGDCQIGRRPFVPDEIIDDVIDVMPSKPLIIHEYRKHGTCSGMEPQRYFALAERLFRTVKIPRRYVNPFEAIQVAPEDLIAEFLRENPQLKRDQIALACQGGRNRLQDIRICMSADGAPRACGQNENQRRLCRADTVYLPPVRSSSTARTDVPDPRDGGRASRGDERGGRDQGGRDRRDGDPTDVPNWDRRQGGSPLPGPRDDYR